MTSVVLIMLAASKVSATAFITVPYGTLLGCEYYRHGCGVPLGLGLRGALALPHDVHLELGAEVDTQFSRSHDFGITPSLGAWVGFDVSERLSLYPRIDVGVTILPSGFQVIVPYYDIGGGLLWRLGDHLFFRAEVTFRGARAGLLWRL